MDAAPRIEQALKGALERARSSDCPPRLADALEYAVFPGGARVRPRLCIGVAAACGDPDPALTDAAACAIELLHCASLAHDDLPCFDDAETRRGKPSLHKSYGEPTALLAGDALIVLAFETLGRAGAAAPNRLPGLLSAVGRAVGAPSGICAGQAWECEPDTELGAYHRAKTGALFVGAATAGAICAGSDPGPWRVMGEKIGEAYQVADDLFDAVADAAACDKPVGRDAALGRPNSVSAHGVAGSVARLESLVAEAAAAIPDCAGAPALRELVQNQAKRLAPKGLATCAA